MSDCDQEPNDSVDAAFDKLQAACEKTARMLGDRQTGLAVWHTMMRENCIELRAALEGLGVISPQRTQRAQRELPDEKDDACECDHWCRDGRPPLTNHHRQCPKHDLESEAVDLVSALTKGMENWAADEDGIHPKAWDAYLHGLVFSGQMDKYREALRKTEERV